MKKCKNCGDECEKIGQINRFSEEKQLCCMCYQGSDHRKIYNPFFNNKQFCATCLDNQAFAHAEQKYYNSF